MYDLCDSQITGIGFTFGLHSIFDSRKNTCRYVTEKGDEKLDLHLRLILDSKQSKHDSREYVDRKIQRYSFLLTENE